MNKTLVILAAGMGSRYGGLKQIDPLGPGGERVIDYSVYDAHRAGFTRVVFVIRRDMEDAFREAIGRDLETRLDVGYAFQSLDDLPAPHTVPPGREKPWGTTHALLAARDTVTTPFASINADDFYGRDAFARLAEHLDTTAHRDDPPGAMVGYRLDTTLSENGTVSRGLCRVDPEGRLLSIEEATAIATTPGGIVWHHPDGHDVPCPPDTLTSMNCWGFHPPLFERLAAHFERFLADHGREPKKECYLPAAIGTLIATGQTEIHVLPTTATWFGVTYQEDKPAVKAGLQTLIDQGEIPPTLWS
jgi:hypothetical protein